MVLICSRIGGTSLSSITDSIICYLGFLLRNGIKGERGERRKRRQGFFLFLKNICECGEEIDYLLKISYSLT